MDRKTSESILKQQLNVNPTDAAAAAALGNHYFDEQNAPAAIVYYQISLANNPNQPGVMTDMATMYWNNQDAGLAEHFFSKVIEQQPDFGNAYINLGLLHLHVKNDAAQAKTIWQRLLDGYPEHPAVAKANELIQGLDN